MESARCKAFIAAAEAGSFSKAAEQLNYTPSGVSQLVTGLETELQVRLLKRTRRGVSLTPAGERLFPAVQRFVQQEKLIYQLAMELNVLLTGELRIATFSSISTHWLPKVIKAFQATYPNVGIKLMEGTRPEIVGWLDESRADIGFMSYLDHMPYDWIPLADDPLYAVLPKGHAYAEAEVYPLRECSREDFIMPANGRDEDIAVILEANHVQLHIKYTTLENYGAMSMIESGLGMSVMNELITLNWQCDVAKVPLYPPQHITLGVAIPSYKLATPAARRFTDLSVRLLAAGGFGQLVPAEQKAPPSAWPPRLRKR